MRRPSRARSLCPPDPDAEAARRLCDGGCDRRQAPTRPTSMSCSRNSTRNTGTTRTRCGSSSRAVASSTSTPATACSCWRWPAGDLIRVPRGTHHWFDLCAEKRIRAIRLFQDPSGWTPHYTESGVDRGFQPLCFGPFVRRQPLCVAAALVDGAAGFCGLTAASASISCCSTSRARPRRSRSCTTCSFLMPASRVRAVSRGNRRPPMPEIRQIVEDLRRELPASGFRFPQEYPSRQRRLASAASRHHTPTSSATSIG